MHLHPIFSVHHEHLLLKAAVLLFFVLAIFASKTAFGFAMPGGPGQAWSETRRQTKADEAQRELAAESHKDHPKVIEGVAPVQLSGPSPRPTALPTPYR